ncbi:unnamed protein product [Amoebophrya sp. A25]|nr:unnamed protein product [Amoebophrya sp. A25]|eukprot:GSA25T00000097001.1
MGRVAIQMSYAITALSVLFAGVSLLLPWGAQKVGSIAGGVESATFYLGAIYVQSTFSFAKSSREYLAAIGYTAVKCPESVATTYKTDEGHEYEFTSCYKIPTWKANLHASATRQLAAVDVTGGLIGGIISGELHMAAVMYGGVLTALLVLGGASIQVLMCMFLSYYANYRASSRTRKIADLMAKGSLCMFAGAVLVYFVALQMMSVKRSIFMAESNAIPVYGFLGGIICTGMSFGLVLAARYWKSSTSEFLVAKDRMRKERDLMMDTESEYDDW